MTWNEGSDSSRGLRNTWDRYLLANYVSGGQSLEVFECIVARAKLKDLLTLWNVHYI